MSLISIVSVIATATSIGSGSQVAVLATHSDQAPQLATQLNQALGQRGVQVLSSNQVTQRMSAFLGQGQDVKDLASIKKAFEQSKAAYVAFDVPRSVKILEGIVRQLEQDTIPTAEKLHLLEEARTLVADRLLGMAGSRESGQAETRLGKRASSYLEACIRTDPLFALSPAKYPPKTRRLMETARNRVKATAIGSLRVTATLPGATIYLEGRDIGAAPVQTPRHVPLGRYRLWAQLDNHRSKTRVVTLSDKNTKTVDLDLAFEGSLRPDRGVIELYSGKLLTEQVALKSGSALAVDWLIIAGQVEYNSQKWAYAAVYDIKRKKSVRRGALRSDAETSVEQQASLLAEFVTLGKHSQGLVTSLDNLGGRETPKVKGSAEEAPDQSPDVLLYGGGALAGAGLLAMIGCALGSIYFGWALTGASDQNWQDRENHGLVAVAMAGGSAAGVVTALTGVALAVTAVMDGGDNRD